MSDLPELFPGFDSRTLTVSGTDIFCRIGGTGPALLLLHGYPQSHVIWHKIAPLLAPHFTLVMPDLPGYGQSSIPPLSETHEAYSKRNVARLNVELMQAFGHDRFLVAGHDRGARVAYRMALDVPEAVEKLAVLDILPTSDYWDRMDRSFGMKIYHWMFLAQPAPLPENLIAASAIPYLEHTLSSWTAGKSLACFSDEAMEHNRDWFKDIRRIAATCEDYRAGAAIDYEHDASDRKTGRKINAPVLVLWGDKGIASSVEDPLAIWQDWSLSAKGAALPSGHFLPEEAPQDTASALLSFYTNE